MPKFYLCTCESYSQSSYYFLSSDMKNLIYFYTIAISSGKRRPDKD